MNLIEAIKSKKPFRRKMADCIGWTGWITPSNIESYIFNVTEVMSNDWEVEEPSVTITRTQFEKAWQMCEGCKTQFRKALGL